MRKPSTRPAQQTSKKIHFLSNFFRQLPITKVKSEKLRVKSKKEEL